MPNAAKKDLAYVMFDINVSIIDSLYTGSYIKTCVKIIKKHIYLNS